MSKLALQMKMPRKHGCTWDCVAPALPVCDCVAPVPLVCATLSAVISCGTGSAGVRYPFSCDFVWHRLRRCAIHSPFTHSSSLALPNGKHGTTTVPRCSASRLLRWTV